MIRASIIGATGYAGEVLTSLLLRRDDVEVVSLASKSYKGQLFSEVYPNFRDLTDLVLEEPDLLSIAKKSDVVFLALPAGIAAKEVTKEVLTHAKVIDLGADFRFEDRETYEAWYKTELDDTLLGENVYGLPELHREAVRGARLIGNPGCYTTASILALAPLLKRHLVDPKSVIVDAASGVTGAGKSLIQGNMFCEVEGDFKAYKVAEHRHTPEIEKELSLLGGEAVCINFTPHLVPMNRGILATCYADLKDPSVSLETLQGVYEDFYKEEYFVRLTGSALPETKYVTASNFIDIGVRKDERTGRVIVLSAIDNLMKGAASQAVQNMNLMFGVDEKKGIDMIPSFPV